MGSRKAVNAQDDSIGAFFRSRSCRSDEARLRSAWTGRAYWLTCTAYRVWPPVPGTRITAFPTPAFPAVS